MAEWEVSNTLGKRTAQVRMKGIFTEAEMKALYEDARRKIIAPYKGRKHILIADLRGLKTMTPPVGKIMGEWIGEHRAKGLALCIHISDETVQRLQVARIARANSADDDVTVDVVSIDEAHQFAEEMQGRLDDARFASSIRG